MDELSSIQPVTFKTWSTSIRCEIKQSTINHVYCKTLGLIKNISDANPGIGDHVLIHFTIDEENPPANPKS